MFTFFPPNTQITDPAAQQAMVQEFATWLWHEKNHDHPDPVGDPADPDA
ncbi:MAG: hypothetical protein AB1758_07565 [Candidatus Eremiobacterota bacterium]